MTPQERDDRIRIVVNQIAKLRRRAQDLTQLDVFGNSVCNQSTMFGGTLPEIRSRTNSLLEELEDLRHEQTLH